VHVIIAGGGKTGRRLAQLFQNHRRHKVTLIDSNPRQCERISELFPRADIVLGDVAHPGTLREAMSRNTEAFVAVTGEDHLNLLAATAAKKMGIGRIILRIEDPGYRELAEVTELGDVLEPAMSISAQVVTRLGGVDIAELIHSSYPHTELMRVVVTDDSPLVGLSPDAVVGHYRKKVYPILVLRGGAHRLPNDVEAIEKGDEILLWQQGR